MPYYTFLCQKYNINYDNILLKTISGKKQKFDVKNGCHDFLQNDQYFTWKNHQKKTNSDFSDKLFDELQELKSILTIFLLKMSIISQKNQEIDFYINFLYFPKNQFLRNIIITRGV